jgi:hypothetical protein
MGGPFRAAAKSATLGSAPARGNAIAAAPRGSALLRAAPTRHRQSVEVATPSRFATASTVIRGSRSSARTVARSSGVNAGGRGVDQPADRARQAIKLSNRQRVARAQEVDHGDQLGALRLRGTVRYHKNFGRHRSRSICLSEPLFRRCPAASFCRVKAEGAAREIRLRSVFEKVDSHRIGVVIHGVSESPMRDECRCPAASAVPIRAT